MTRRFFLLAAIFITLFLSPTQGYAATKFMEPGGDATFTFAATTTTGFWATVSTVSTTTDIVHGTHAVSLKISTTTISAVITPSTTASDAGTRISFYIYVNALPSATASIMNPEVWPSQAVTVNLRMTSAGILQLWNGTTAQIGSNGATLSTGRWYRVSLAYTITSTSVNRFELFVDGVSSISVTNATVTNINTNVVKFGNLSPNTSLDLRLSDFYIDNSSSLTDPGNIWVAAKRPFSNGTTNAFTTRIGSGSSGYGSGHALQVNERPLSTVNGWSIAAVGATTEEYNVETNNEGDIDLVGATIVDVEGWVTIKALIAETASIIVDGVTTNIPVTTAITNLWGFSGSASFPAGVGTDVGVTTSATVTTVSLYEAGVMVAYIPSVQVDNHLIQWILSWW